MRRIPWITLLICAAASLPPALPAADLSATYAETLERATAYEKTGELDLAIGEARRLTQLMPDNADGHFWLARLLREYGQYAEAIRCYERGIMLDPSRRPQALWNIAYSRGRWSAGLESRGDLSEAIGQLRQAVSTVTQLQTDPEARAMTSVDLKKALQIYQERMQTLTEQLHAEDLAAAQSAMARAAGYFERGRPALAERELLNAVELDPGSAAAWKELSRCHAAQNDFGKAAEACRKAIALDPKFKEAHNNLGSAEDELKHPEQAIEAYRKALEIDPKYVAALANLGLTYQKMGDHAKAAECYQKALTIDPDATLPLFNMAGIQVMAKNYDAALDCCRRVLRAEPFNLDASSMMGDICLILNRPEDAVTAYKKALIIAPKDPQVQAALQRAVQQRDAALLKRYFGNQGLTQSAGDGTAETPPITLPPSEATPLPPTPAMPLAGVDSIITVPKPVVPDAAPVTAPARSWDRIPLDTDAPPAVVQH